MDRSNQTVAGLKQLGKVANEVSARGFKSDRGGIETLESCSTSVSVLRSNQTVAGLKPIPESAFRSVYNRSNQTVAGLKR